MIAYVDSSVLLRVVLGQRNRLKEWKSIDRGVSSALVEVECLRTLDRLRLVTGIEPRPLALRREATFRLIEALEVVELGAGVLVRASHPLPMPLGILDAIHLATALLWRERTGEEIVMATHDEALALAARGAGLRAVGV